MRKKSAKIEAAEMWRAKAIEIVLAQKGKKNAITSPAVAAQINRELEISPPVRRESVRAFLAECDAPIVHSYYGFFAPVTGGEIMDAIDDLEGRIKVHRARIAEYRRLLRETTL